MKHFASERHYQLANAITEMASRLSASMHFAGLAFGCPGGQLQGKTYRQYSAAGHRQYMAIQRLTRALRDLEVTR